MDEKYQKQLENIADWTKELVAENTLLWAVAEAAKDVYEWADPTSELQQAEMLFLHDAMNAVQTRQNNLTDVQQDNLNPADSRQCRDCGRPVKDIQVAALKGDEPICLTCFYADPAEQRQKCDCDYGDSDNPNHHHPFCDFRRAAEQVQEPE